MKGGKSEDFWPRLLRLVGNQGWIKNNNESWHEKECEDSRYVLPFNLMNNPIDDLLTKILDKVEGYDMILQEMNSDVSTFSTTIISHLSSIKLLEEKMGQLTSLVYANPHKNLFNKQAVK
ncbi:hypothetical protein R3W88_026947 [Solanum pinnatisectum]|uniref:Uncharacterized protein n=1 Tax=Solanum pinnatisectum TaxID=50273 RepID=A0AAV9LFX6_9SOLN|nr:hypothetical protein R3W88_026947 [Solanum pinnatisectum]